MTGKVLILNGADVTVTLDELRRECEASCADTGLTMEFRQSDDAKVLLQWIGDDGTDFDGLIINPGRAPDLATVNRDAYYSAIAATSRAQKPVIEIHLENIFKHADSVVPTAKERYGDIGFVCGFGKRGYSLALQSMARKLAQRAARRAP